MKHVPKLFGVISLVLLLPSACAPPPEPDVDLAAQEQSLREFWDEVSTAYANRDGQAMGAMCDDPFLSLEGILRGPERIEAFWKRYLESLGNTELNVLEELGLEMITPEVGILQTRIEFTNRPPDAEGNPQPREEYFAANVLVKRDGRWLRKAAFLKPLPADLTSG